MPISHKRAAGHPAMPAQVSKMSRTATQFTLPFPISPDDCFSSCIVAAQQCVKNMNYRMGSQRDEPLDKYFTTICTEILSKCIAAGDLPHWLAHIATLLDQQVDVLTCDSATYGQLKPMGASRVIIAQAQQEYPFTGEFTSDSYVQLFVDLPQVLAHKSRRVPFLAYNGSFFEPMQLGQQRASSLSISASLDLGASFSYDKFGDHIEPRPSYSSRFSVSFEKTGVCIKFEFGAILDGEFDVWETLRLVDNALVERFSAESQWPPPTPEPTDDSSPPPLPVDDAVNGLEGSTQYDFTAINGKACVQFGPTADGALPQPFQVANFVIVCILKVIQDEAHMHAPLYLFLIAMQTDHYSDPDCAQNIAYRKTTDTGPFEYNSDVGMLHIECMINMGDLVSTNKLQTYLQKAYARLLITGRMTADMFRNWMCTFALPDVTYAVTHFGTQTNGEYVVGNVIMGPGSTLPKCLTRGSFSINTEIFNQDSTCPVAPPGFPRMVLIEYPHVRHVGLCVIMQKVMPAVFLNNTDFAIICLGWFLLSLHCKEVWAGKSGIGNIMPLLMLYSFQPSTGKSQIVSLIHCMMGYRENSTTSGTVTKAGVMELCALQHGGCVVVDDVVPCKDPHWPETGRCVGDGQSRVVSGKIRQVGRAIAMTTNFVLYPSDVALWSRFLALNFAKLKAPQETRDDSMFAEFTSTKNIASMLVPDFLSIGMDNGGMDSLAIADVERFLCKAVTGNPRERVICSYAMTLYYTLQLLLLSCMEYQMQSVTQTLIDALVVQRASDQNLDRLTATFVSIDNFMHVEKPGVHGESGKNIGLHNFRAEQIIIDPKTNRPEKWTIFRYQLVLNVLRGPQRKINVMTSRDFLREVEQLPDSLVRIAPYTFWDVRVHNFPIMRIGDDGLTPQPMTDYEMPEDQCTTFTDVVWVKQSLWNSAIAAAAAVNGCSKLMPIETILIAGGPHKLEPKEYNFLDKIKSGDWRGFRALENCHLAPVCGITNDLEYNKPDKEACERTEQHYNKSIQSMFYPSELEMHFGTTPANPDALPDVYTTCPFPYDNPCGPKAKNFDFSPKPLPGSREEDDMCHDEEEMIDPDEELSSQSSDSPPCVPPSSRQRPRTPLSGMSQNVLRQPRFSPYSPNRLCVTPPPIFSRTPSPAHSPDKLSVSSCSLSPEGLGEEEEEIVMPQTSRRRQLFGAGFEISHPDSPRPLSHASAWLERDAFEEWRNGI